MFSSLSPIGAVALVLGVVGLVTLLSIMMLFTIKSESGQKMAVMFTTVTAVTLAYVNAVAVPDDQTIKIFFCAFMMVPAIGGFVCKFFVKKYEHLAKFFISLSLVLSAAMMLV